MLLHPPLATCDSSYNAVRQLVSSLYLSATALYYSYLAQLYEL